MAFLAKVNVSAYEARPIFEKMSLEDYNRVRSKLLGLDLPEDRSTLKDWYTHNDMMIDEEDLAILQDLDIPVTLKRLRGLKSPDLNPLPTIINQISVANVGLMQIRYVDVLEDACTNDLQRKLDDGWRILAVCPPNDTRRPTYIIGQFEQPKEST